MSLLFTATKKHKRLQSYENYVKKLEKKKPCYFRGKDKGTVETSATTENLSNFEQHCLTDSETE